MQGRNGEIVANTSLMMYLDQRRRFEHERQRRLERATGEECGILPVPIEFRAVLGLRGSGLHPGCLEHRVIMLVQSVANRDGISGMDWLRLKDVLPTGFGPSICRRIFYGHCCRFCADGQI